MRYMRIMILVAVFLIAVSVSAIASADGDVTFTAVGDSIGYSKDILSHSRITPDANEELMGFEVQNHNNPVRYNVALSKDQYSELKSAKDNGEIKELQIRTNQPVVIENPVIENYTKMVCFQDYYDEDAFERDLSSLEENVFDSSIDINVTDHVTSNGAEYKRITLYKTYYVVKSFEESHEYITAHVVVNNMQADGKDWVFFHAPGLGMDGVVASSHIEI